MRVLNRKEQIAKIIKKNNIKFITCLLILVVLCGLSVSYAYLSNQLNIYGTAYISGYILEDGVLPSVPVKDGDNYFGGSAPPTGGTIDEDYWDKNIYNLTFGVPGVNGSTDTYSYTVKVQNNTEVPWTNGTVTSVINSQGESGKYLKSFIATLSATTVNPGETLTITFDIKYRTNPGCTASATSTAKFLFNGEERILVFNMNFNEKI